MLIKTPSEDPNTLLIFVSYISLLLLVYISITIPKQAGLFSSINTAFLIEAYKDLNPDPYEATNDILRSVF